MWHLNYLGGRMVRQMPTDTSLLLPRLYDKGIRNP